MLLFIDQPKSIKVFRLEQGEGGAPSRVRLGSISKNKMELSEELKGALSADENQEVENAIAVYQKADKSLANADIYRFPQIIREVTEYITSDHADEFERRLLIASLMDGLRHIRKFQRQGQAELI